MNLMGWPRLKCLGPGSAHPTYLLFLLHTSLDQLARRVTHFLLLAALLLMRSLPLRKSHDFLSRHTTSTYSQHSNPYHISAHRGTPILSSTLSPQVAVSRIAAPLPMRYRLSAISHHYDFALLTLIAPMCDTTSQKSIMSNW